MLSIEHVSKAFGGLVALDEVSFHVTGGEIVGLIGPNGSGKTTCVNTISGLYKPTSGRVDLDGSPLSVLPAHRIVRRGVGRTFQNLRLLRELSVLDNIRVAQGARVRSIATWCGFGPQAEGLDLEADALRLLEKVGLRGRADALAGKLSYGQQKRLEVARALATRPRFVLLDEPAGGMNVDDIDTLKQLMRAMRDEGIGLLLIEHNMSFVMDVCDRLIVLNFGKKLAEGSPAEIRNHSEVIDAYLGRA